MIFLRLVRGTLAAGCTFVLVALLALGWAMFLLYLMVTGHEHDGSRRE